jgi:[acyl-carrier-protein] S-malonyltransferase
MHAAFIFPGQGSQYAGMGREFYTRYPEARAVFAEADQALGFSITDLCFTGPAEELNQTVNTQPAVLAASLACLAVLTRAGLKPAAVAGHSLGEYTALVAAGSLSCADAVRLVQKRGRYMQEAVPVGQGGMAAVMGLSAAELEAICRQASAAGVVEAVNFNCPGQVVIAGETAALQEALALAKKAGARRCVMLAVSAPFHSTLMQPAGEKLAAGLTSVLISDPVIPVVANVNADFVRNADEVRKALIQQVYNPVRWEESILRLAGAGIGTFIEVGPGRVLSGLVKKICRGAEVLNVEDQESLKEVLALVGEVG